MIGIIGAFPEEINEILKEVKNLKQVNLRIRTFYTGSISGKEVVIVLAGIGKVNAGITTSILIENFDVTSVINIGVAGGQKGVSHKDVIISREVLYHDVDLTYFSDKPYGQMSGSEPLFYADKTLLKNTISVMEKLNIEYKIGKIASGDQFITKLDKIKEVNAIYDDIYAIEMEAAAIAHACTLYSVPFIVYRSISDVIDNDNQYDDFYGFLDEAIKNVSLVLTELIKTI